MKKALLTILALAISAMAFSQDYMMLVNCEINDGTTAVFTSAGMSDKVKDVEDNAVKSLFHTLFYVGVEGVNKGKPLITNDNPAVVSQFFATRMPFFVKEVTEISKPQKNAMKKFQAEYRVSIVLGNLLKDMERNKLYVPEKTISYDQVEDEDGMVLPTIMVVPYKRDGETYASVLQNDYDRRIAIAKVQDGFEKRNITTVDLEGKLNAVQRNAQFGTNDADSNDKQLLMNSGSDVYVTVDILKDNNSEGNRISLIMKAYETASGSILASKDALTRRFPKAATDVLCSYAIEDNIQPFLDDICKNFTKQASGGKRVSLIFAIDGASAATMNDRVGSENLPLSAQIRQWVRKNSYKGKYHLQGIVGESIIFDYVMIPAKDAEGYAMDAAQFGYLIEAWLNDQVGVTCTTRVDGTTVYVTIY